MDLQGNPVGSTSQGTKNTSDPAAYRNPKEEGTGAAPPDSLAAESARDGGEFVQNRTEDISTDLPNPTNTDLSGATTLAPAPNATEREAKAARQETSDGAKGPGGQKYAEGVGGQGEFPGTHSAEGYRGGSTAAKEELSSRAAGGGGGGEASQPQNTGSSSSSSSSAAAKGSFNEPSGAEPRNPAHNDDDQTPTTASRQPPSTTTNNIDPAPSYVPSTTSQLERAGKPKGHNITEGGFSASSSANDNETTADASSAAEIGSENDPGREAVGEFQRRANVVAGVGGGGGGGEEGSVGEGRFGVLGGEEGV